MQRKQTGYVYKRAGWWVLRYRQTVNQAGTLKVVQRAARLVPAGAPHYRTKASVRDLAEEHLAQINKQNQEPQTVVTISDFVTRIFLTKVAEQNRPSSVKNAH